MKSTLNETWSFIPVLETKGYLAAAKFRVGDIVRLKTGSPRMIITKIEEDMVTVTWFSNTNSTWEYGGSVEVATFPAECLFMS